MASAGSQAGSGPASGVSASRGLTSASGCVISASGPGSGAASGAGVGPASVAASEVEGGDSLPPQATRVACATRRIAAAPVRGSMRDMLGASHDGGGPLKAGLSAGLLVVLAGLAACGG